MEYTKAFCAQYTMEHSIIDDIIHKTRSAFIRKPCFYFFRNFSAAHILSAPPHHSFHNFLRLNSQISHLICLIKKLSLFSRKKIPRVSLFIQQTSLSFILLFLVISLLAIRYFFLSFLETFFSLLSSVICLLVFGLRR